MKTIYRLQLAGFLFLLAIVLILVFQSGVEAGKRDRMDFYWGWYNCTDHEDGYPRCVFKFYDIWDMYIVDPVFSAIPEERKIIVKLYPVVAQQ